MRYFYKLFLSIVLVLTAALAIVEYASVAFSLKHSFQRELDSGLTQYQLVKHAVQTAILNAGNGREAFDSELSIIGENAAALLTSGGGLLLSDTRNKQYFSNLSSAASLDDIKEGHVSYQVVTDGIGTSLLLMKSMFTQNGSDLVLMTEQDVSLVFSEAEALRDQCTRLYFAVLGICALVSLGLSWVLTRPLAVLRKTSRAFAEGDYSARAQVRMHDEVGELADSYNKMASTIEDKISQLEAAAQRQERFTASFAHELKTPMTSIIGYADTIYQKDLPPEQVRQSAWYIMNEGMRLEALSFKLLDLLALNRTDFTLEETDVSSVFHDIETTVLPLYEKRGVQFICRTEPGWVRLEFDLFKTLMLNLLDNALKSGANQVTLSGTAEGEHYKVEVSDNGRGIPKEELQHITEAFYMVDKSRSRKEHGAGLGLALAASIADIHGTKLSYDSEPDRGTVVSFTLRREVIVDDA